MDVLSLLVIYSVQVFFPLKTANELVAICEIHNQSACMNIAINGEMKILIYTYTSPFTLAELDERVIKWNVLVDELA